jgi:hypothetical protein
MIPTSPLELLTPMKLPAGSKHVVEISTPLGLGSGQIVRVYRKLLMYRRRLSSDWFLDPEQAERFARKTAANLAAQDNSAP